MPAGNRVTECGECDNYLMLSVNWNALLFLGVYVATQHIILLLTPYRKETLSGLSTGLWTKGLQVPFPVRAQALVSSQVPSRGHMRGNHTLMFLSLSFSFPYPRSKNKLINLKNKKDPVLGGVWILPGWPPLGAAVLPVYVSFSY